MISLDDNGPQDKECLLGGLLCCCLENAILQGKYGTGSGRSTCLHKKTWLHVAFFLLITWYRQEHNFLAFGILCRLVHFENNIERKLLLCPFFIALNGTQTIITVYKTNTYWEKKKKKKKKRKKKKNVIDIKGLNTRVYNFSTVCVFNKIHVTNWAIELSLNTLENAGESVY